MASVPNIPNARAAALMSRIIPTMTLSTASNPMTAPLTEPPFRSAGERATARFTVQGNAVFVGGAGTLALASARALLEHGLSQLVLTDIAPSLVTSEAEIMSLRSSFPNVPIHTFPLDATQELAVVETIAKAADTMGGINILCYFAGAVSCVPSALATSSDWHRVMDVNLSGAFLCAQAAASRMVASKTGGIILFVSSMSGQIVNFPQPQAAYNVSKAGLVHLTKCLAVEWAVDGIRVNCISPGYMDTVLNAGDNLRDIRAEWAIRCPLGRMGDVEEITGPVVMLCSQRASRYITGANLTVDGGTVCF